MPFKLQKELLVFSHFTVCEGDEEKELRERERETLPSQALNEIIEEEIRAPQL